jgi:hypothetical protein
VCIPWREARLSVRPGITGLWQICRHERSSGDFHQWIYYDRLYVDHVSPWLDLKILVATALSQGGRFPVPLSRILPPAKFHERRRLPRLADGPDLTHLRLLDLSAGERREDEKGGGDRVDLQVEVGDMHQHPGEGGEQPLIAPALPAEVWPSPRGAVSDAHARLQAQRDRLRLGRRPHRQGPSRHA